MILTRKILVKWHRKTIEHYEKISVGGTRKYKFTRFGDSFEADINDVHQSCTVEIKIVCDYCSKVHPKIYRNWKTHFDKSPVKKDTCTECRGKKIAESNLIVYKSTNVMHLQDTKEKLVRTNILKYGVPNAASTKETQDKMKITTLKKYGLEYYFQTDEFKEKYNEIMQERYGVDNGFQAEEVKEKSKQTMLKKYGVKYNMQNAEIRKRAVQSMYERGSTPTSKPQIHLHEVYGGVLNYPFELYNLDIALLENKIAIEYDGGAHDLKVTLGGISQEDFNRREIIRGTYLKRGGWKLITIVSKYDFLPSEEDLLKMLEDSIELFSQGRSWVKFNIDESSISYKDNEESYKFKKVEAFKKIIKRKQKESDTL